MILSSILRLGIERVLSTNKAILESLSVVLPDVKPSIQMDQQQNFNSNKPNHI